MVKEIQSQVDLDKYMRQAIILCAGEAGRMKPLSYYMHKSMLPLQDGRPVIDHIVDHLHSTGFEPIIALSKGNHEKQLKAHLGPKFTYSVSDTPLGTAGEVYNAWKNGALKEEPFLVYYGDTITDLDPRKTIAMHDPNRNIATITAYRGARSEYGIIEGESGKVSQIEEKAEVPYLVNLPVFWCEAEMVRWCEPPNKNMPYDFFSQLFPFLMEEGHRIGMYVHRGTYKDIGRLTDYAREAGLE